MTKPQKMLFALLRLSLGSSEINAESIELFSSAKASDWDELFALSIRQGTLFLCYEGFTMLPPEQQPYRQLKLRWCANVLKANERFDSYRHSAVKLSRWLKGNGIDMLLFKGISISEIYPTPCYRSCGDMDIYTFGKANELDALMASHGFTVEHKVAKNSQFKINGITVENHVTFFDTEIRFKREANLYCRMEAMLMSLFTQESCPTMVNDEIRKLPLQAEALFMIGHSFRHFFSVDVSIRQFCDWMIFFSTHKDQLDLALLSKQIKELGIEKFVAATEEFCQRYLGYTPVLPVSIGKKKARVTEMFHALITYREEKKPYIPILSVCQYLIRRHRLYCHFWAKISLHEFVLPELKCYLCYLVKQRWR